jgi:bifunctional DNA-binding transcriptional regulator/antitoxin component of YhaV-PrlF toxin-antitoxin module
MSTRNITITSKNQITLPIDFVRNMHLTRNRVLQIELRGKAIVLTPQPMLGDTMRQFWGKHNAKRPLSDDEIKQAVRTSSVERIAKGL